MKKSTFKEKFRSIKKFPSWIFWFPATILKLAFALLYRFEVIDPNNIRNTGRGYITVIWHNRLLFFPAVFPKKTRKFTRAVISASRDGQYIADLVEHFGIPSLRGSSSKKGANAQLGAIRALRENCNVSFTPDGPRGPKYVMKSGPVHLASVTGAMVLPLAVNYSRYWSLKSWDGFQIPKPFAKITLIIGEEITVPPGLSDEDLEKYRVDIERKLIAITRD